MNSEVVICVLCLVSFFLLCWTMLLRLYIKELERKIESLQQYLSVTSKLEQI